MFKKIFIASALSIALIASATFAQGKGKDNKLTGKEKKQGWELMFDGNSLNNRHPAPGIRSGYESKDTLAYLPRQ